MGTPAIDEAGGALVCLSSNATKVRCNDTSSWWHDETHDCVIALRPILDADGSSTDKLGLYVDTLPGASPHTGPTTILPSDLPHGSFSHDANVVDVKLSVDQQFFAVQRSDIDVDVWSISTSSGDDGYHPMTLRYSVMCKRTSTLLGLIWNAKDVDTSVSGKKPPSQYLVLVTTGGLELFKITPNKCKFHRILAYPTHLFWWHPGQHVLVLATGPKATELRPYFVDGGNLAKASKVVVGSPCLSPPAVTLAYLYSTLYLVYAASSAKEQLLLYRVHPSLDTVCVRALRLGFHDPLCSVLDNLLVVHSAAYGVTCFYDVGLADADPFLHPLPLHLPNHGSLEKLVAPHYALLRWSSNDHDNESSSPQVHAIHLNVRAIAACAAASGRPTLSLARFLLRRRGHVNGAGSIVVLEALFAALRTRLDEGRLPEPDFRACVHLVHHHEAADLMKSAMPPPSSKLPTAAAPASHHLFLPVSQHDWLGRFWRPLQHAWSPDRFTMYLGIFLDSLRHHALAVIPDLHVVHIQALAAQGRCGEMVAFPMDDSLQVARELEMHRQAVPAMHQAAMDMYHRLGAVDDLVRLFLHDGHVTIALRLALRYASSKKPISHSAKWFFDQVVAVATRRGKAPADSALPLQGHANSKQPIPPDHDGMPLALNATCAPDTCDHDGLDEGRSQGRQYLYALYVFLSAFAPADMAQDAHGRSPLSHSCTFPDELFPSIESEDSMAAAASIHFRRLFGFPNVT